MVIHYLNNYFLLRYILNLCIIVIIILAAVSINLLLSENGIIKRAEQARGHQANAEAEDNAKLNELDVIV